jgi:hypothetical protein
MPFGVGGFNPPSKSNFKNNFSKNLGEDSNFSRIPDWVLDSNPFKFTPSDTSLRSRIRFYDNASLWSRWRRGYELYSITQTTLGSFANERSYRGDYRLYCAFQQYPGSFIPVRLFTFPTTDQEIGEQIVAMRDTNSFNFYDFSLPILSVRYLGNSNAAVYSQTGTTITITKFDHGFLTGENVYIDVLTGAAVDETLTVVSTTQNTFTLTASSPVTTAGNLSYYLSTNFDDLRWTTTRVALRYLPNVTSFLTNERLTDRVVERDQGVTSTYVRVGTLVTVTCGSAHGLASGNSVFFDTSTGTVDSERPVIIVLNSTQFTFETLTTGAASGAATVYRLIKGYRYDNYVGYTLVGSDASTNEVIFTRDDSYGTQTVNNKAQTRIPAYRGFEVGRFLTTELRWQCSCQDYSRKAGYNLYSKNTNQHFPVTAITSTKPGQFLQKDGTLSEQRDSPGSFGDLGYITINNFYELPTYKDTAATSYPNLMYYQLRWCKHIYAAMFSLLHDEGNEPISIASTYSLSGPNITVDAPAHGLKVNSKIQLDFSSGNAISGQYTISSVPNPNQFVVVYPFSGTSTGYCSVSNIKEHEYVGAWLLEPSDKPVGDDLDTFYRNFDKELEKLKKAAENLEVMRQGLEQGVKWVGTGGVTGAANLPEQVANYNPQIVTMLVTDSIRRSATNELDRDGVSVNTTNRMISIISKLLNLTPPLIQDAKFGMLDEPLINYASSFEFGFIQGGVYRNGAPIEEASTTSIIDCGTYTPLTSQDTVIDAGFYVNT